ncbi:ABC-2 type transport system permease protein [Branchiibius hedensis]|uniref:ABC-2 type transport system permease protein n=1 Tax=Branchiibius hedensis TaxID=672460 RepID=A0A2Y8ZXQ6_9MICO|nr:ABC transporter permease [Branchiibius hedensis]PWJ27257.1 ABC-2 type transport system permease protein [Branchiibius hedensis]SSA36068.1 ABC-2 type transport system permease protein [Branchiibius hedensis]
MNTSQLWRIVAAREMSVKLKDRNFIVSTVAVLVLIIGALAVQGWLASRPQTTDVAVLSSSATSVTQQAEKAAHAAGSDKVTFKTSTYADQGAAERAVTDGKADVALLPTDDGGWRLVGKSSKDSAAQTWIPQAVQQQALQRNAAAAGVSLDQLAKGSTVSYDLLQSGDDQQSTGKIMGLVFGFLFYIAALLFGMSIASSVIEEKQNRIVEILASAIPLRQLLIGKVVGNTVLALAQVAIFAVAGIIGLIATGRSDLLSQVSAGIVWFILFFIVGFVTFAAVWAVAGALATRNEDLQSTSTPLTMLVVIVFIVGISGTGIFLTAASYVPLLSTIAMPVRVVSGDAAWWEPVVSLLIGLAAAYLIVRVAEKLYRRSLLQTGHRLSYREALALTDD